MAEKENIILGISLGCRRLGMAVGTQNELIEWQMKVFLQIYSKKKVRKIWRAIEQKVHRYGITEIGMKLPPKYSRSDGMGNCLKYITEKALEKDIALFFYDLQDIEAQYNNARPMNKKEFAERVAEKYPLLKRELFKLGKSQHNIKIFEAVASMDLALFDSLDK